MAVYESVALAIALGFVVMRARFGSDPRAFLRRMALLAAVSWVAEDSCIRAYGFYAYSPSWSLFVDRVPLAIFVIWPAVIHSAWELARRLSSGAWTPLVGGLFVLADASMIEPIAVRAGLWHWNEPGLMGVPPIGVLGWACYAALCMVALELAERRRSRWAEAGVVLAPLGAHALLVASWWGLFRWVNGTLPAWPAVALLWALSAALTVLSLRGRARRRVPPLDMLGRVPAAVFFFVLLAIHGGQQPELIAWALAFAPPYLSLTRVAHREAREPRPMLQ